jgi:hypothetical protein
MARYCGVVVLSILLMAATTVLAGACSTQGGASAEVGKMQHVSKSVHVSAHLRGAAQQRGPRRRGRARLPRVHKPRGPSRKGPRSGFDARSGHHAANGFSRPTLRDRGVGRRRGHGRGPLEDERHSRRAVDGHAPDGALDEAGAHALRALSGRKGRGTLGGARRLGVVLDRYA